MANGSTLPRPNNNFGTANLEVGRLLVMMRSLSIDSMHEEEVQRSNIFHTKCRINEKVCLMTIDGGSCTNIVSTLLVEKLGLPTTKHPHPYRLQWFSDRGEEKVNLQTKITFTIGKFSDEVLCDVVPMEVGHLLLGRPWIYDRDATHCGRSNRYQFKFNGKKFSLIPLIPSEAYECRVHIKKECDKRRAAAKAEEESAKAVSTQKSVKANEEEAEVKNSSNLPKTVSPSSSKYPKVQPPKEEEIEEIIRTPPSLTSRTSLSDDRGNDMILSMKGSNLFCNLSLKVSIPYRFLTNFMFSYLPTQIVIVLQADNSYQVQKCFELECQGYSSSSDLSLAIVPYTGENSILRGLNCSNFVLQGKSLDLPLMSEVLIDFVFGDRIFIHEHYPSRKSPYSPNCLYFVCKYFSSFDTMNFALVAGVCCDKLSLCSNFSKSTFLDLAVSEIQCSSCSNCLLNFRLLPHGSLCLFSYKFKDVITMFVYDPGGTFSHQRRGLSILFWTCYGHKPYKLKGECNVIALFNVTDLSPFAFADYKRADSRTNPLKEGGDDVNQGSTTTPPPSATTTTINLPTLAAFTSTSREDDKDDKEAETSFSFNSCGSPN